MLDSIIVYLGFAIILIGLLSLIRPIRFLRIRSRSVAAIITLGGLVMVVFVLSLPVRDKRASSAATKLDEWMPVWQFDERHAIHVDAPPEKVFAAIRGVHADEILFFRTLIAIRRCGRPGPEAGLNAPEKKPILEVATTTTFAVLADESPRELVIGTVVVAPPEIRASGKLELNGFRKVLPPGTALAIMNFFVTPDDRGGSHLSSETRVYANDAPSVRRFAIYWRLIHPGSDIIRRMWLRAIKQRAEGKTPPDSQTLYPPKDGVGLQESTIAPVHDVGHAAQLEPTRGKEIVHLPE